MRKIAVLLGCAGLLVACSNAPREPAPLSMNAPVAATSRPAQARVISAPDGRKGTAAKAPTNAKAKVAKGRPDRVGSEGQAPKRTERPIQKASAVGKAPAPALGPQQIPLD
jgi:hypothetical protein